MRARVTKLDDFQFLTCLQHGLWGSRSARFKDWQLGDKLVLLVGNAVGGVAEVAGKPFKSSERVWDNDLFPHRIPMRFTWVPAPDARPPVLGEVRHTLSEAYDGGGGWGLGILNQRLMKEGAATRLLSLLFSTPNVLPDIVDNIGSLLATARLERERKHQRKDATATVESKGMVKPREGVLQKPGMEKPDIAALVTPIEPEDESYSLNEATVHFRAQRALVRLGRIVGCSVWVASNDRNRVVDGKALGEGCLTKLPNMGLGAEATKAIGLIDVIWLRQNAPLCAFEVEATTSVHSGLLRMSDLVELVPAVKMQLYIVAPKVREAKVMRELQRPTFRRIGLNDFCRYVSIEDLETLAEKLADLKGHVQPTIVDTIAQGPPDELESAMA